MSGLVGYGSSEEEEDAGDDERHQRHNQQAPGVRLSGLLRALIITDLIDLDPSSSLELTTRQAKPARYMYKTSSSDED